MSDLDVRPRTLTAARTPDLPVEGRPEPDVLQLRDGQVSRRPGGASGRGPDHVVDAEHLGVAIACDAVNYGISPGDASRPRPYAYVGPHEPRTGPFWNAPFGAAPATGGPRRRGRRAGVLPGRCHAAAS